MPRNRKIDDEDVDYLAVLLDKMVSAIVDNPEWVRIGASRGSHAVMLEIQTDPDDVAFVIGRERQTFNAMERILTAAARTRGVQVRLDKEVHSG